MNYYNYFTEIEELFVRRRGKHMYVSPMDWSLIATWRDSGVPLHVALRGIDIAMDTWHAKQRRASARLSTLFYCHDAVMAEYTRHLEAHLGGGHEEAPAGLEAQAEEKKTAESPDKNALLAFLEARIREIKAIRAKHYPSGESEEMERILFRLEEIRNTLAAEEQHELEALERDLGILDELLVENLKGKLAQEQMDQWEEEARKELKVYKKRLPKETYQKILANFLSGKIHRLFQVGELSLFHL